MATQAESCAPERLTGCGASPAAAHPPMEFMGPPMMDDPYGLKAGEVRSGGGRSVKIKRTI